MAVYILVAIIAYAIGSVNFSIIFSKKFAGFDVREKGSGNAGTTNMLRSVGKGLAALTLICDILKGVVAVLVAFWIGKIATNVKPEILVQLAGFFAVVGHTFPVYFGFIRFNRELTRRAESQIWRCSRTSAGSCSRTTGLARTTGAAGATGLARATGSFSA